VLVDVQNTLVINAVMHWAPTDQRKYCRFATNMIGAYYRRKPVSHGGSLATRARNKATASITGRKLWITNGNEADMFIVFMNVNPDTGYRGIGVHRRSRHARIHRWQKEDKLGIRASGALRADLRLWCRSPDPRQGRQGLQGGDRNAERRPHRHRRANARPRAGRAHTVAYVKERKRSANRS
jgi:hypothetical protein